MRAVPDNCAICIEALAANTIKLACGHAFHKDCIRNLFFSAFPGHLVETLKQIAKSPQYAALDRHAWEVSRSLSSYFERQTELFAAIIAGRLVEGGQIAAANFPQVVAHVIAQARQRLTCPLCRRDF